MLSITFANPSLFEFLGQVEMFVSEMLCQIGHVGSLGLRGFKASFTDGLCGVRGFALTVGYVTEINAIFRIFRSNNL